MYFLNILTKLLSMFLNLSFRLIIKFLFISIEYSKLKIVKTKFNFRNVSVDHEF